MATLITPRMLFLHLPKTGGSWATAAMLAAGVPAVRPEALPFHGTRRESSAYGDRFTFAFVRHPLEYWRSYWAYRMREGWNPASHIDAQTATSDFDLFIDRVIERVPGDATALYEAFLGRRGDEIDFIGHHERLADDLVAALRLAGERFDEQALQGHPPVNVSDYARLPARYGRRAAERLVECERAAIERFYPGDPVPVHLLDERDRAPARPRVTVRSPSRRTPAPAQRA